MRTFAKVTARDGLLLHRSSSPESERLELMPLGSRIEILDEKHPLSYVEWHSPKLGQLRGWAHERWLQVDAIKPPHKPPHKPPPLWPFALAVVVFFAVLITAVIWAHGG